MPTQAELAQAELARRELARRQQAPAQQDGQRNLTDLISGRQRSSPVRRGTKRNWMTEATQVVNELNRSIPFFDEFAAGAGAINEVVQGRSRNLSQAFAGQRQLQDAMSSDLNTRRPNVAAFTRGTGGAAQVVPALATAGATAAPNAFQMAVRARPLVMSAATGVGAGAINRFADRGTVRERTASAGNLGAVSVDAALGVAFPVLARGAGAAAQASGRVVQRLVNRYGPNIIPADRTAARIITDQIEKYGYDRYVARFNELRRDGIANPTPVEIIPGLARRVGSVARNDLDGARTLARNRTGGMVANVPISDQAARRAAAPARGTVAQNRTRNNASADRIQDKIVTPVRGATVTLPPNAVNQIRTPNLAASVRSVQGNLRTDAVTVGDRLAQQADILETIRNGYPVANVRAPAFDARKTQAYADNLDTAMAGLEPVPDMPYMSSLPDAIRSAGGIRDRMPNLNRNNLMGGQRVGEIESALGSTNRLPGIINNRSGLDPADMGERLRQSGFLGEGRTPVNEWEASASQMSGIEGSTDDVVALLREYVTDPARFRYGRNPEYVAKFDEWLSKVDNAEQQGLGAATQQGARSSAFERTYENYTPAGPERFDNVPSAAPMPNRLDLNTVEALRRQIQGAEQAAINPDQADFKRSLSAARHTIVDPARVQIPEYDRMLKVGDKFHRANNAMDMATGSGNQAGMAWDTARVPLPDLQAQLNAFGPMEANAFRIGAAERLAGQSAKPTLNISGMNALANRGDFQDRAAAIFGRNSTNVLARNQMALLNRVETAQAVNPNFGSPTALNQVTDELTAEDFFSSVPTSKMGIINSAIRFLTSAAGGLTPQERYALVDMSTRPITQQVEQEVMRLYQTARNRKMGQINPIYTPTLPAIGVGLVGATSNQPQ